jgi:hypothetical protein
LYISKSIKNLATRPHQANASNLNSLLCQVASISRLTNQSSHPTEQNIIFSCRAFKKALKIDSDLKIKLFRWLFATKPEFLLLIFWIFTSLQQILNNSTGNRERTIFFCVFLFHELFTMIKNKSRAAKLKQTMKVLTLNYLYIWTTVSVGFNYKWRRKRCVAKLKEKNMTTSFVWFYFYDFYWKLFFFFLQLKCNFYSLFYYSALKNVMRIYRCMHVHPKHVAIFFSLLSLHWFLHYCVEYDVMN